MTVEMKSTVRRNADAIAGERIHQIMWRDRIPQAHLAAVLGLSQTNVSKRLRGSVGWTLDELLATARFLGVELTDILPEDDYNPAPAGRGRGGVCAIRDSNPEPADLTQVGALITRVAECPLRRAA